MKKILLIILALATTLSLSAATLSGTIKDIKTNKPLEFANVAVYENDTEDIKTGTMSGIDGTFRVFNVPAGNYYLIITYMGYEQKRHDNVVLNGESVDVGTIFMTPTALKMEDVVVEAEKPAVTYKIDKRVIDASQFLAARGGTAVEVLENVPSVDVDIEGNVSLRGSENFTVMIDGRPSVLEPQDALESIPAASIENIEIMTNASAKFEAEGGAGIINIVTKRDKRIGITGLASFNAGTNNLGGDVLLNYTNKKITAFVSFDYSKRNFGGESYVDRFLYSPDTTSEFESEGIRSFNRGGWGVRGGLDYFFDKNNVMGFSFSYGPRNMTHGSVTDYVVTYSDPVSGTIFNTYDYTSYENTLRGGSRYSVRADYTHTFPEKEEGNATRSKGQGPGGHGGPGGMTSSTNGKNSTKHQLKVDASFSNWNMDEDGYTYLVDEFGDTTEGQRTTEIGPSNSIRGNIEYTRPLNMTSSFETGANVKFNWKSDGNDVYYYDPLTGNMDLQDQFSNYTDYKQNTFSGYALYTAEFGLLGVQPGLRAEYTYREIDSDASDSLYVIDRLHVFPTLHLSYQLPAYVQLMASYTRRVSRPRGWQLEPFLSWMDAYNVRIGNPGLSPEMTDSYEFSVQKSFGKSFVSLDAFYKYTNNKIERIETVYEDDVILNTYENVGNDRSLGIEPMANLNLFSWWMMNVSGRLYYYQVEGVLYDEPFNETSTNYSFRLRNTFLFPFGTRMQLGLSYRSRSARAQGTSSGGLMTDLGIRQDFFKGVLSATLQVRDIFGTGFRQYETYTPSTYTYSEFYRDAPMVSLDLSLKINNYKNQNKDSNGLDSDDFNSENGGSLEF
ncbi:MAG: TonB-dependent receptor [Candidatus Marinimicrobia bacterium]|nr:TonB-dependent receptor [Candidatus Neomarinimicrobiota bacterium]